MLESLAKKIGAAIGLGPKPPQFDVPAQLPKLNAQNGGDLARVGGFTPAAPSAPVPAQQSPAEFLRSALNERQEVLPVTKALAHHLPPNDAVKWAVAACRVVAGKLTPADQEAVRAAEAFVAKPDDASREAAAAAAAKTDYQGPGAWAAQAAALTGSRETENLLGHINGPVPLAVSNPAAECVAGAVALAASLAGAEPITPAPAAAPATPATAVLPVAAPAVAAGVPAPPAPTRADTIKAAHAFKPFIDRGLQFAADVT